MISFILSVVVSIASFGAVSNNESVNNAEAINRAIEHCAGQGGGRVVCRAVSTARAQSI